MDFATRVFARKLSGILFVIVATIFLPVSLISGEDGEETVKPVDVYVGVYVNQIFDVSLKDNKFSVDFYVWFRWIGDSVNPVESFEVVNGRMDSKNGVYEDEIKGYQYASCRVVATMTKFWDISKFPLDDHIMTIEIEDNENEDFKLTYIPDTGNCGINPQVEVPGWKVSTASASVVGHSYQTNYGDISLPSNNESVYSRFIYSIAVVRPGYGYFFKLFFGVFIAAMIAFLTFFIKPTDLDPRFGLGVGAIFAAVASEYVIASALPDTNLITMADKLHILAFIFIFLSIAESVLSLRLFSTDREGLSKNLDKTCFIVFMAVYIILSFLLIVLR
ncbi:MAG TPA: hypothetical protein VF399_08565 [bacterium]